MIKFLNKGGIDTSDATATAVDILSSKTAYVNGEKVAGTMLNNGALSYMPSTSKQTIPAGYTSGGTISAMNKQNKTVNPTISQQIIEPDGDFSIFNNGNFNLIDGFSFSVSGNYSVSTNINFSAYSTQYFSSNQAIDFTNISTLQISMSWNNRYASSDAFRFGLTDAPATYPSKFLIERGSKFSETFTLDVSSYTGLKYLCFRLEFPYSNGIYRGFTISNIKVIYTTPPDTNVLGQVTVNAVTSAIDENIVPRKHKISEQLSYGITGIYEGSGGGGDTILDVGSQNVSVSGTTLVFTNNE